MNSPPADQQFPAELLQLQKSELFQWNLSNVGLNVALRFTMVFTVFAATQHTTDSGTTVTVGLRLKKGCQRQPFFFV